MRGNSVDKLDEDWEAKVETIAKLYPKSVALDWSEVFGQDPAILGRVINDVIKLDQRRVGRPGKRPSLAPNLTAQKLKELQGEDHTNLPFPEALKILTMGTPIKDVLGRLHVSRSHLYNVFERKSLPSLDIIEQAAIAFGKHPSYFLEYRVAYIVGILQSKLTSVPESSIVFYRKLAGYEEKRKK